MYFFEIISQHGKNIAVIDKRGQSYTYDELISISDIFSRQVSKHNKKLIFILCKNEIGSLAAYLSCLKTDNAVLLLDHDTDNELLNKLLELYNPDYIWEPRKDNRKYTFVEHDYGLIKCITSKKVNIHPDLNVLLSTSGSTGSPKLVRLTKDNLQSNAMSIAQYLELNSDERPITTLSMHYSYGLSVINSHFLVGATLLLTNDSIISKEFWEFFKKYKATSFAGVPYTFEILNKIKYFEMNLHSIRYSTQAGGKLDPVLVKKYAEHARSRGIKFFVMYGQTEASPRISYIPYDMTLHKDKSIGIAIPDGKLFVVNENLNEIVKPYTEGEIVYKGKNVMMGYATRLEDLEMDDELGGYLRTGDIGYFDNDGYFYISGRKKRFLKVHGNRVNLDDIEIYLKSKGYECVCGGEDNKICIGCLNESNIENIKNNFLVKYNFHHTVVDVIKINKIIKNSSGKILYNKIFAGKY